MERECNRECTCTTILGSDRARVVFIQLVPKVAQFAVIAIALSATIAGPELLQPIQEMCGPDTDRV